MYLNFGVGMKNAQIMGRKAKVTLFPRNNITDFYSK